MTDRDNEIRKRCEAATPGQWEYSPAGFIYHSPLESIAFVGGSGNQALADAAFIAASRTDIPYLLDSKAELEQEIAAAHDREDAAYAELERLREAQKITGETSDGYHSFNELYHHRAVLFSVICRDRPAFAWKSKKHYDGTMFDGMFIVGIDTENGQATYHYDIDPYWEMFRVREIDRAPEWDGHTPAVAIERIGKLGRHLPEPVEEI